MSGGDTENIEMAQAIGEIQGTLKSLVQQTQLNNAAVMRQMQVNNDSTNQRITDLSVSMDKQTEAINRRITDHKEDNKQRFVHIEERLNINSSDIESRKHDGKKAAGTGGAAAVITTASIEIIKHFSGA